MLLYSMSNEAFMAWQAYGGSIREVHMCRVINLPDKINVVPFCYDVSGREMELICFENTKCYPVTLEVDGTILKYGIEPEGYLFAVMCDNCFVISLDRICCMHAAFFRDGACAYQFENEDRSLYSEAGDDRRFAYWSHIDERYERGTGILYEDGAILLDGYRIPKSPQGLPFVFARRDFDYIDSCGHVFVENHLSMYLDWSRQYILASVGRGIKVLSDRTLIVGDDDKATALGNRSVVDVRISSLGCLVLCQDGSVFHGKGGKWNKKAEDAYAIAANADTAAIATEREIIVYHGTVESPYKTIKVKNGWRVTELGVSCRWLIYNTIKHGASAAYFDKDLRNGWQYFHRTKYPKKYENTFY